MFPVHTTPEEFNTIILNSLCLKKNSGTGDMNSTNRPHSATHLERENVNVPVADLGEGPGGGPHSYFG